MLDKDISFVPEENEIQTLKVGLSEAHPFRRYWCRMINGGLAKDLLRGDMQQHIIRLHEELHFEYIRFWDIYAPELFLYSDTPKRTYNFSKLDSIIDFLIANNLRPYIELGFKPIRLLKNTYHYIINEDRNSIFATLSEYGEFLTQLLKHWVNRYGISEVEQWYFEEWRNTEQENLSYYFEKFDIAYEAIKSFSSNIQVGGSGINWDEGVLFETIIRQWKKRTCYPDFFSIYSYPYDRSKISVIPKEGEGYNDVYSRNSEYMKDYVDAARKVLNENGFWNQELHISEWNFTVSNRSCLNDSIFKGAYIVKNLLDVIDKTELVGYWFGSDLFSEYYDTEHLLDGSGGLLSKDGICKPAFYAFSFMNRLGEYLLGKNANSVVTTNLHDTYCILCHHYVFPNYKFFMKKENETLITEESEYFDSDAIRLHFSINGVKNGTYQVKRRTVNKDNGSVQDEWIKMGLSDNLNIQDIGYLRQICVPRITIEMCNVLNHCIELETVLKPNEIQFIHIVYQL